MFLLLHKLRHVLPNDVKIVADPAFDLSSLRDGLRALNYEVTNLEQNLHQLIEKAGTYQPGSCIVTEESVRDLREGFKRKREREVIAREEMSSQKSDLKKLWWDFMVDQMLTDTAVGKT